jgi:hypothetical protein
MHHADNSTGSAGVDGWMGWHLHHGCAAGPLRPTRTSGSLPTTGHTLKRVPSSCGKKRRARFGLSKGEITCRSVRVLHARCAQEQTCRVSGRRTVPAGECGARAEGVLLDLCVFWPPEVWVPGVGLVSLSLSPSFAPPCTVCTLAVWLHGLTPTPTPRTRRSPRVRALCISASPPPSSGLGRKRKS